MVLITWKSLLNTNGRGIPGRKEEIMNIGVIFAGGTGQRMNTKTRPKQFLELHGKPILVYTLEEFNNHPLIDGIVLVVLEDWIKYCERLVEKYKLDKVKAVVPGGKTAMESQRNGLQKAKELFGEESIVLIHDGVRPLIDAETIKKNIQSVIDHGTAITVTPEREKEVAFTSTYASGTQVIIVKK